MIDALQEHRLHYQETLFNAVNPYHYRFTRYHANYSVVLAYISEESGDLTACGDYLRGSDSIIYFRSNFCAIIFDSTNEEQGIKAANNVFSRVQARFFSKHFYMTVITATDEKSEFQMIHDLFDLMSYALEHNMDNLVLDSSQVI
ncbi:hypothetical protein Sulku_0341 [Sulfuricurvum kujiense DSM 16994]|uniref:GGDEF domain-containing protein n=1 Tax=Sulfuricurvum kujiense (strain ATCC BAA-921 / DSM 16994 / JCM 11577 / YK-1) TaxID=709032 RepID=E4TZ09_SULKY|nr:hypothetical protein [Sulfuricurvum kujiense]ADR33008.1 hypothetical protein Sulku_0341 [Sulfuricurvum kujiense DSM 16994]